eukprot:6673752-Ditylum_brightwellii.AAC.2
MRKSFSGMMMLLELLGNASYIQILLKYFVLLLSSCSLCLVVTSLAVTQVLPTGNPLGEPGRLWQN